GPRRTRASGAVSAGHPADREAADGLVAVVAPMQATVVSIEVAEGDVVAGGQPVVVLESMKMEHLVAADGGGTVQRIAGTGGDTVDEGDPLVLIEVGDHAPTAASVETAFDLERVRDDLAEVRRRQAMALDEARPDAVSRRHDKGQRTARENIDNL